MGAVRISFEWEQEGLGKDLYSKDYLPAYTLCVETINGSKCSFLTLKGTFIVHSSFSLSS